MTAALLLGWTCKYPQNLPVVLEKVMSTMYSIIHYTKDHSDGTVAGRELKLIQSKKVIEDPPMLFEAKRLSLLLQNSTTSIYRRYHIVCKNESFPGLK